MRNATNQYFNFNINVTCIRSILPHLGNELVKDDIQLAVSSQALVTDSFTFPVSCSDILCFYLYFSNSLLYIWYSRFFNQHWIWNFQYTGLLHLKNLISLNAYFSLQYALCLLLTVVWITMIPFLRWRCLRFGHWSISIHQKDTVLCWHFCSTSSPEGCAAISFSCFSLPSRFSHSRLMPFSQDHLQIAFVGLQLFGQKKFWKLEHEINQPIVGDLNKWIVNEKWPE